MNRLQGGDELKVGDELTSRQGWVRLVLQADGDLVLYRTQVGRRLWASNTAGHPVSRVAMMPGGNLVAETAQGTTVWASGTGGNAGVSAVLQDDGDFVVRDALGKVLWKTGTVQDFRSPTLEIVDANGYAYLETSETWKITCSQLPCFGALHWPGYATLVFDDEIDGEAVVIQLWKGWIPTIPGVRFLPGGVGGEVGVYRRMPGSLRVRSLPLLPGTLEQFVIGAVGTFTDREFWWPFPELDVELEFTLINPVTGNAVFSAGPERSYWLTRWMTQGSHIRYCVDQGGRVPLSAEEYVLEYSLNGRPGRWPSA